MRIPTHRRNRRKEILYRFSRRMFLSKKKLESPHVDSYRGAGFSLIEAMLAMLILGLSLLALVQGVNTALLSGKEAEVQSVASMLAAGQVETLRAQLSIGEIADSGSGEFTGALSIYSYRQTVTQTKIEGLYEVTVAIEKTDTGEEVYELKTMLFDPPYIPQSSEDDKTKKPKKGRS
jgi:Tfp pilus assembly protein PilV